MKYQPLLILVVASIGCGEPSNTLDAGFDSGTDSGGRGDAGRRDAGRRIDAGPPECVNGATRVCAGGSDLGDCSSGMQVCSGRFWGKCLGSVGPTAEACDGRDNDCDDAVDEAADAVCELAANATAMACVAGACEVAVCVDGRADCDGFAVGGCETELAGSSSCAACADPCSWGCVNGTCDDAISLSAGYEFTCAVQTRGGVACWGDNQRGQLGVGVFGVTPLAYPSPVRSAGGGLLRDVLSVDAGGRHACALLSGGRVVCWGDNEMGQLGAGSDAERLPIPQVVVDSDGSAISGVSGVSAGSDHSCAVTASRTAVCWGRNDEGQLGTGDNSSSAVAQPVVGVGGIGVLDDVAEIVSGGRTSCAVLGDARVACWGWTPSGLLSSPSFVPGIGEAGELGGVEAVTVGTRFACAILAGGAAACWGEGGEGQLGGGAFVDLAVSPVEVLDGAGVGPFVSVRRIDAGRSHVCAATDVSVFCWGSGSSGQLGNGVAGPTATSPLPVLVRSPDGSSAPGAATELSAGGRHSCAIAGEDVACWGRGGSGELGNGAFHNESEPMLTLAPDI